MTDKPLVNRVASSGLVTINLENYFPQTAIKTFDLKDYLFMELILKEKDFRAALAEHDWTQYEGKALCIFCSNDSIIPTWAFMLVATYAAPYAADIVQADEKTYLTLAYHKALEAINPEDYEGKRIVIKGCSGKPVPVSAYVELTRKLQPVVKSIMFGEPCSTVPIYKKPK
ncbi:MAG: DUF2480 family protein [Saprospiraceae bacterium]|nr:DUF2480 family protein [Saprospiraceae bacterium]